MSGSASGSPHERVLSVRPALVGVDRADRLVEMGARDLLHAGPPFDDPTRPCLPVLNAAAAAILHEGWAGTAEAARALVRDGGVTLRPAQDLGCVVPLADVVAPSMWLQQVRDLEGAGEPSFSPLNGGNASPARLGVFNADVVRQLRWVNTELAAALRQALVEPIALIELADQGLQQGDDCHGRTPAATAVLAARLDVRLEGEDRAVVRGFLAGAPGFFLNLWMAASRCMLSAAAGIEGSDIVVGGGGNGQTFGIRLAGRPGRWVVRPADPPRVPDAAAGLAERSLGAIGDSAIVDLLGFGAMTTLARRPGGVPGAAFAPLWPSEAGTPEALLCRQHPAFALTGPRVIVEARAVAGLGHAPIISLAVLDRTGEAGRIGAGFYRPPVALFADAMTVPGT